MATRQIMANVPNVGANKTTLEIRSNEIFASLFNLLISQEIFSGNIDGTYSELVDMMRTDGSMYGEYKEFVATKCLESEEWGMDDEASSLLELYRPEDPDIEFIYLDQFRQIRLTVDYYLTKRAWKNEGAFSAFTSVMLSWIRDTKRVYDSKLMNTFIGTTESTEGKQSADENLISYNAETDNLGLLVAEKLANTVVNLKDPQYDYNDFGNLRSYGEDEIVIVWNNEIYNQIKKVDLPVIFHNEGLLGSFKQVVLPAHYFGNKVGDTGTATTESPNLTVRSTIEKKYEVASLTAHKRAKKGKDGKFYVHVFPSDLLPDGVEYNKNEAYTEDATICYKIITRRSVPYMSAFEVGTSFFNPKSLTETHFLTFGHNTLKYLKNFPFITAKIDTQGE